MRWSTAKMCRWHWATADSLITPDMELQKRWNVVSSWPALRTPTRSSMTAFGPRKGQSAKAVS
eukprot:5700689-Lingulodinium_polyedra.AAC.1